LIRLAFHALVAALLGAIIGAVGMFILSEGLPEGAIMGAILGGSIGIFIAARIDAHQSARRLEEADPAAARRSAALLSARQGRIRDFRRDSSAVVPGINPLRKLEDSASGAPSTGEKTQL